MFAMEYVWSVFNYDFKKIFIFDLAVPGGGLLASILCTFYVAKILVLAVLYHLVFFLAIIQLNNEGFKKKLSNVKKVDPIKREVITKTGWKIWTECKRHFDAILNGDEVFDLNEHFTFVAFFKYIEFGGTFFHIPQYIIKHPYYPTFKQKVEEIPLEKILNQIETLNNNKQEQPNH